MTREAVNAMTERMFELLEEARSHAHAPLSGFHVGAVALGRSGQFYLGSNFEAEGHPLGLTMHAEQAAFANAYMARDPVEAIAVTAAPCGHCRQFMLELCPTGSLRILLPGRITATLTDLVPHAFTLPPATTPSIAAAGPDALTQAAIEAADRSHAPYTQSPSGVALLTDAGRIFTGAYIESAAFNPSLSPLHTALASLYAAGLQLGSIRTAVLVESKSARISHEATLAAILGDTAYRSWRV